MSKLFKATKEVTTYAWANSEEEFLEEVDEHLGTALSDDWKNLPAVTEFFPKDRLSDSWKWGHFPYGEDPTGYQRSLDEIRKDMLEADELPFDPTELDPGIRDLVVKLNKAGWLTTDSGDGKSKPADQIVFTYPHVAISIPPSQSLTRSADNLIKWLKTENYPIGDSESNKWTVEANYSPLDKEKMLFIYKLEEEERKEGTKDEGTE